jgi:hypothetical protein
MIAFLVGSLEEACSIPLANTRKRLAGRTGEAPKPQPWMSASAGGVAARGVAGAAAACLLNIGFSLGFLDRRWWRAIFPASLP